MLVGTITDAWNQLNTLNQKYPLPAVPQVPSIPSYPLPKPSGTAQTTQAAIPPPSPRTLTGTVDVDIGLDWKTIGLVVGGVAVLGAGAYLLLRKPRRRRRRR